MPEVEVGPFWVSDSPKDELVDHVVELTLRATDRPAFAYALHVGGLNARRERDFVVAMRQADVVYADGGSVVWLARLAGGNRVERAPTTDIGWDVMRGFATQGRPAPARGTDRRPGRAGRACRPPSSRRPAPPRSSTSTTGSTATGRAPLEQLRAAAPDITIIGLGAPREMVWSQHHRDELPAGLVLTCGGWFGHIVGDEKRAPRLLRRSGLEWIARVAQAPGRLGPRYAKGAGATAILALSTLQRRSPSSRS